MRVAALALVLFACASTQEAAPLEETPLIGATQDPQAEPAAAPKPRRTGPITLERRDLVRVLDRGPRDFLRSVDEDPLVDGGRFRGWIFRGWRDDRFAGADLLPGDVILTINGKPIEKPDQFMGVWDELRKAPELAIQIERDGKPMTIRYPIHD